MHPEYISHHSEKNMKRTWQCPKCESAQVGYFESLIDASRESYVSRSIGLLEGDEGGWLGPGYTASGEIEAFVCTDCGYFEEYVKDPKNINWDKMEGWRWCHPELREP